MEVCQGLFHYVQAVKRAPKLSSELHQEAVLVSLVIKEIASTIANMETRRFYETLNDAVAQFSTLITDMKSRVVIKKSDVAKRLIWPFTEQENEAYRSKLERFKSTFTLCLVTVQRYVQSTSTGVNLLVNK